MDQGRSEFVAALRDRNIAHVLDIGSDAGQFGDVLRQMQYKGFIYSVEANPVRRLALAAKSVADPQWIVLLNQHVSVDVGLAELQVGDTTLDLQSVLVNRADQLMLSDLLAKVGAIHIGPADCDLATLKAICAACPAATVLQVASPAEQNEGSVLTAMDKALAEQFGFVRVPGSKQNDGAVYLKPIDGKQPVIASPKIKVSGVFTSIGGPMKRPDETGKDWGKNWSQSCQASWLAYGAPVFNVTEVNIEIQNIQRVATLKKPAIREVFQKIGSLSKQHSIVTNSDILLTPSLMEQLPRFQPDTLYIGNRVGVSIDLKNPAELKVDGYYRFGFDFFVIPSALVQRINTDNLMPKFLRIGEPWWDYALPLIAMDIGTPIKNFRLMPPAALHLQHQNSSNAWYVEQGHMLLEYYATNAPAPNCQLKVIRQDAKTILADGTLNRRGKVLAFYDKVIKTLAC